MGITPEQREKLLNNGLQSARDAEGAFDPIPVVKLFQPDGAATWLLTELDPNDPDLAYGLIDRGDGTPDLDYVRLSAIAEVRGGLGLAVEQDRSFRPCKSLSLYHQAAKTAGCITA